MQNNPFMLIEGQIISKNTINRFNDRSNRINWWEN